MIKTDFFNLFADKVADAILAKNGQDKTVHNECLTVYYTVEDVCPMLHISKATYYRHHDQGFIQPAKYVGRKPLFTQKSIDDYLNNFQG